MKRALKHRGGIAMILVVVMMAAAAVMSFALLSSASMQAEATRNSVSSSNADTLAQSGTNLAMYYLMYPDKASTSAMSTSSGVSYYNPGTNVPTLNLADGSAVSKIDVALSSHSGTISVYGVNVTAKSGDSSSLTRTLRSQVQVQSMYTPKYALASNDSFTIPLSGVSVIVDGNVRSDGGLGGLLSAVLGPIIIPNNTSIPTYPAKAVPTYSQLNLLKSGLPAYPGGTAQLLGSTVSGTAGFPAVLGSNPDSVFYTTGSLTLSGTVNITGTIVVPSGKDLYISSNAITITTKKTGQPALVVGGNLIFNGGVLLSTRSLTVNGLAWLGGDMKAQGGILPTSQLTVNGALMWGGSSPKIDTASILGSSYVHVNWPTTGGQTKDAPNWDYLYVPNLADEGQIPRNVKVLSSSFH